MDFENGVIIKIYKSEVDPILVGGRLRRPQTKMGISSGPMIQRGDHWMSFRLMKPYNFAHFLPAGQNSTFLNCPTKLQLMNLI